MIKSIKLLLATAVVTLPLFLNSGCAERLRTQGDVAASSQRTTRVPAQHAEESAVSAHAPATHDNNTDGEAAESADNTADYFQDLPRSMMDLTDQVSFNHQSLTSQKWELITDQFDLRRSFQRRGSHEITREREPRHTASYWQLKSWILKEGQPAVIGGGSHRYENTDQVQYDSELRAAHETHLDQGCAVGTVRVAGQMKRGDVESIQNQHCNLWMTEATGYSPRQPIDCGRNGSGCNCARDIDRRTHPQQCACYDPVFRSLGNNPAKCRCFSFDEQGYQRHVQSLPTSAKDFCMDRFEFPNQVGQYPIVMASWEEAGHLCEVQGKRLCGEDEWTFACEGPGALPYPYGNGYIRDNQACNVDGPAQRFVQNAAPNSEAMARKLAATYQALPSGASTSCRSHTGVHDLVGNVDEWTASTRTDHTIFGVDREHNIYPSINKGGYWGPIRGRCRPSTRDHYPGFTYYQIGFRCCSNPTP